MLEARTGRWAVAVKISIRQLREQLTDFIACGHIQGFPTLRTGVEAFRWGAPVAREAGAIGPMLVKGRAWHLVCFYA